MSQVVLCCVLFGIYDYSVATPMLSFRREIWLLESHHNRVVHEHVHVCVSLIVQYPHFVMSVELHMQWLQEE